MLIKYINSNYNELVGITTTRSKRIDENVNQFYFYFT